MPNWTYCKLKAPVEVLREYIIKNDDKYEKDRIPYTFDFNLLIPQPEAYSDPDLISGGDEDFAIYWYLSDHGKTSYDKLKKDRIPREVLDRWYFNHFSEWNILDKYKPETKEESKALYERGRKYVVLADKYGYRDWYDWRRANWGTKWNACDCDLSRLEDGEITFNTAWCPPVPVIEKLFDDNPGCRIEFYWENEDYDGRHHYIRYKNGRYDCLNCEGAF